MILVALLAGGGAGAFYLRSQSAKSEQLKLDDSSATSTDLPGEPTTDDPSSNSVKTNGGSSDDNTTPNAKKIDITTTYVNGDKFEIRTSISRITTAGECTLTMQNEEGKTYTTTVGIQALPSSSTCKGFSVPISSLSSGTWTITVDYVDGSEKSSSSKDVMINA